MAVFDSEGILSRVISSDTSSQVWSTLQLYFVSQTRAKASQYKTQLKNVKKGNLTMNEYLIKMRGIINLLNLCDEEIS